MRKIGLMILIFISLVIITSLQISAETGSPPDNEGGSSYSGVDWTIQNTDDVYRGNQTLIIEGDINISAGGKLTLYNVTLKIHSASHGQHRLLENDTGELVFHDGTWWYVYRRRAWYRWDGSRWRMLTK